MSNRFYYNKGFNSYVNIVEQKETESKKSTASHNDYADNILPKTEDKKDFQVTRVGNINKDLQSINIKENDPSKEAVAKVLTKEEETQKLVESINEHSEDIKYNSEKSFYVVNKSTQTTQENDYSNILEKLYTLHKNI